MVELLGQCHRDGHPLMSKPRAEPSLPPPPCGGGSIAINFHRLLEFSKRKHETRSLLSANGSVCGGGGGGGGGCGSDLV